MADKFDITQFGKTLVGKFTFKVPEGHAEAGAKKERSFDYQELTNEDEAQKVLVGKKWTLLELVNDAIKATSRANSYQTATAAYRPFELTPEQVRQRMITDYIRSGASEEFANQMVDNMLAAIAAQKAEKVEVTEEVGV